jgi:UDP-glucose 4-epimerase
VRHLITGVAGFVGSLLADALLADGETVAGVDDFSLGRLEHLADARRKPAFSFVTADLAAPGKAETAFHALSPEGPPDIVWHLAANSDIAAGVADPEIDYRRTFGTTLAVARAAKDVGAMALAFASSSAVYGEREGELDEDAGPLLPISSYGAAKLASEAVLSAAAETTLERLWIFRFPNVVGPRATHGVLFDFVAKLKDRPAALKVLGDGAQTKPYLHVSELIAAMRFVVAKTAARRNVFNIGPEGDGAAVSLIAQAVIDRMAPGTPIAYAGGDRGWIGDVPRFAYSTRRLAALGWRAELTSEAAVRRAADELTAGYGAMGNVA